MSSGFFSNSTNLLVPAGSYFGVLNLRIGCRSGLTKGIIDSPRHEIYVGTVVPLLRDHPVVHTKVVFEEGWSFIRGRKQCKPKHVSSGIVVVVFNQGGLSRGGLLY